MREETIWGRLGKTEASVEIYQGNEGTETQFKRWRQVSGEVVGIWFLRVEWRLTGTNRSHDLPGKILVYSFYMKQNINRKISTEGELIGIDDISFNVLWSIYFIKAQGYNIAHRRLIQDNKSVIVLEKNQVLHLQVDQTYQD